MRERNIKLFLFLLIIIGFVLFGIGIGYENIFVIFVGIFLSVTGFIGYTFIRGYYLLTQVENVHDTLKKYNTLHLAICSECSKENILEDVYCVKCGNKLGEEDGENI